MKNKKGTIILSIILAVQFIIPLSVWGYETYKNKELEEKGQEVKLIVDWANYDEQRVEFHINDLEDLLYSDDAYIVFENNGNVFSTVKTQKDFPETDLYVGVDELYSWYSQNWCFKYESEITKEQNEFDSYHLYNKENEKENIRNGNCEGPETQAYAVFKVYKNRFKVVNVYIDGMPVDTVIEKDMNDELDLSRYEYHYDKEYGSYLNEELIEEIYDAVMDEYVTEPVAA